MCLLFYQWQFFHEYLIDCLLSVSVLSKIFPHNLLLVRFYVFISSILLPMTSFPWVPGDYFSLFVHKMLSFPSLFFLRIFLFIHLFYQWLIFHEYLIIVSLIYWSQSCQFIQSCFVLKRHNSYFLWVSFSCFFLILLSNFLGFFLNVCISMFVYQWLELSQYLLIFSFWHTLA